MKNQKYYAKQEAFSKLSRVVRSMATGDMFDQMRDDFNKLKKYVDDGFYNKKAMSDKFSDLRTLLKREYMAKTDLSVVKNELEDGLGKAMTEISSQ